MDAWLLVLTLYVGMVPVGLLFWLVHLYGEHVDAAFMSDLEAAARHLERYHSGFLAQVRESQASHDRWSDYSRPNAKE